MSQFFVSFFTGTLFLLLFREIPSVVPVISITFLILLTAFYCKIFKTRLIILGILLGFLWIFYHSKALIDQKLPSHLETKIIQVKGTISSIPEINEDSSKFQFDVQETHPANLWKNPGKIKIRVLDPKFPAIVGDQWLLSVKLKQVHSYANPGGFDFERLSFYKKISAEGYVVSKGVSQKIASSWISHPIDRIRMSLAQKVSLVLAGRPCKGIVKALVVGLQNEIKPEQWGTLRDTGTSHLVAISGMHIGLVSGFIISLIYFVRRYWSLGLATIPTQQIAIACGFLCALIYALLAGFTVPTQRALVMMGAFTFSVFFKRLSSSWRRYCLALGIVVLIDPLSVLSVGFWLSFVAVGLLLLGMGSRVRAQGIWWKWGRAQWVVFIGLIPVTLGFFGTISLISPLTNLIAIPWVSFLVVPFSLLGSVAVFFNEAWGSSLLLVAETLMNFLMVILDYGASIPKITWNQNCFTVPGLVLAIMGVLINLLPKGFPGKAVGLIWFLPLIFIKPLVIPFKTARVTVLDVGQGLSTVVETENHVLVFDTGPKLSDRFDTGQQVVLPFLAMRGHQKIDLLMISHGDNDHAGGAGSILKEIPVHSIVTTEPELFPNRVSSPCVADQSWNWDGVQFEVLHPNGTDFKKRNDNSCVLRVSVGNQSALLTADIEAKSEQTLIDYRSNKLPSTILVVPHHGSRTSSTEEFIAAVNPQYAVFPFGYKNQYGHPKPDIVARYQKRGINLLNTVDNGAVTFTLSGNNSRIDVKTYRQEYQHFWNVDTSSCSCQTKKKRLIKPPKNKQ